MPSRLQSLGAYKPDQSNIGIWLWIGLGVLVISYVSLADLWLRRHQHEYMTTEYREALQSWLWGPVVCFLTFGFLAALFWHFFIAKNPAGNG
jgi:hypothetical protein